MYILTQRIRHNNKNKAFIRNIIQLKCICCSITSYCYNTILNQLSINDLFMWLTENISGSLLSKSSDWQRQPTVMVEIMNSQPDVKSDWIRKFGGAAVRSNTSRSLARTPVTPWTEVPSPKVVWVEKVMKMEGADVDELLRRFME